MKKLKHILLVVISTAFVTLSFAQHKRYAIKNGIEQFINEKKAKQSDVTIAVTEKEKSIDTFFEIAKDISLKILYNNLNISTREFVSNFSSDIRTTIKDIIPKMLKIFGDYITYCLIDNR